MAHLARSLPSDRFTIHLGLITRTSRSRESFPSHLHLHRVNAGRVLFGAVGLVRLVRKTKPDLILSGMFHLNFLVLLLKPFFPRATRILVRQNGMLSAWPRHSPRLGRLLYRLIYPYADGIVSQTHAMADELQDCLGSQSRTQSRIHVLPNPVDSDGIRQGCKPSPKWTDPGPHLLAIGRLSPEKGFDLLLEAFASIRIAYSSATLTVLGDGPERHALETRSATLGLGSSTKFEGHVSDPFSWFAGAALLVIPSRCEALPNVLLEGAAAGLPIVATPCSACVTQLLQNQPGTWLAQEVSSGALAHSLDAALTILGPGERFSHPWIAPFHLSEAVGAYENLILETLALEARQ